MQAYNAQIAVDELQLIVGQAVTQETNDKKQLLPMITTIAQQSGETPSAAARRRRLLLGGEHHRPRGHADRRLHLDAEAEARRAPGPVPARAAAQDGDPRRPHDAQAAHEGRRGGVRGAESDRRTRVRSDQTRAGLPPISVAGDRQGPRRVVARVHDAQHSEAISALRLRADATTHRSVASCRGPGTTRPTRITRPPELTARLRRLSARSRDHHLDLVGRAPRTDPNGFYFAVAVAARARKRSRIEASRSRASGDFMASFSRLIRY